MTNLTEGTRLFNRGDRANAEHFATIIEVRRSIRGVQFKLRVDGLNNLGQEYIIDAYQVSGVDKGHGGTRIVTKAAYDARRAELMADHYGVKA